jgi:hypothetical protein
MDDPATLLAERDEWRGDRSGPVVLRLHVEALVDARPDPAAARSALNVHVVLACYGAPSPVAIAFPVPPGARLLGSDVRLLGAAPSPAALAAPAATSPGGVDPEQATVSVTLPAPPEGGLVEAILRFEIPGTLVSDARWLGLPGLPVAELLLRYDLPEDAVGSFQTTLPDARPVVTEKEGRRLIALLATRLPPLPPASPGAAWPHARYVTVKASPKGYDQAFAPDWGVATADYRARLVEASDRLDAGYEVPYRPVGSGRAAVLDALAWVRSRPMRQTDPFAVRWDAARPLPDAIAKNDLTAVDRVHLLHWILREARLPHVFLMARAPLRPPLDPAFPVPGAFEAPLVFVEAEGLVLDPACDTCAPGAVREGLSGGQAIALPLPAGTRSLTFIDLPTPSTP